MYTEGSRGTLVNAGQPRRIVGGGRGGEKGKMERTIRERSPTRSCLLVHANTRPISTTMGYLYDERVLPTDFMLTNHLRVVICSAVSLKLILDYRIISFSGFD